MITLHGKCSWFGGPHDMGVSSHEGLALVHSARQLPDFFLPDNGFGLGLARRLNPDKYYIACRWDYHQFPISYLLQHTVEVTADKRGLTIIGVQPVDWGPNSRTGRIADLSPGLMKILGVDTDDFITVKIGI